MSTPDETTNPAVAFTEVDTLREVLAMTVRSRLAEAGMTQADAAAFVGISQKHLSQMLNGRVDGSLSLWQRLLDFVNHKPSPYSAETHYADIDRTNPGWRATDQAFSKEVARVLADHGYSWGDGLEMLHCDCDWTIDGYIGHEDGLPERDGDRAGEHGREIAALIRHRWHVAEQVAAVAQSHHDRAVAEAEREVARLREGARSLVEENVGLMDRAQWYVEQRDEARAEVARLAGAVERVEALVREFEIRKKAFKGRRGNAEDAYANVVSFLRAALTPATDEREDNHA